MTLARTLMVQGTASSVGKSLIVTAMCRAFRRRGVDVAPFKAQNMSLNAYVTRDGLEMGRAQVVQAFAAGIEPTVDMNPILLKPEAGGRSQIIVSGRVLGTYDAYAYMRGDKEELREVVASSLKRLRERHELVIIEGAGSPAEVNLQARDIVNMYVARLADAPVILVGDIDRGGVFASLVGTLALLPEQDRSRVRAFLINKFRGDLELLKPGLVWLEEYTKLKVLGVMQHLGRLRIADEDSLDLDDRAVPHSASKDGDLVIAVVRLPCISNHDEFQPLEHESGVTLRFVHSVEEARDADLVILPGSKSTVADLAWLRAQGFADLLRARVERREPVFAICGGFQMLGESIEDPEAFESHVKETNGLGLLPIQTRFGSHKRTERVEAKVVGPGFLDAFATLNGPVSGYVIHAGRTHLTRPDATPWLSLEGESEGALRGAWLAGTMVHGLFEHAGFRECVLTALAKRRGLARAALDFVQEDLDRLTDAFESSCDPSFLDDLVNI